MTIESASRQALFLKMSASSTLAFARRVYTVFFSDGSDLVAMQHRHTVTRETAWTLPTSEQELPSAEGHQQIAAAASATSQMTASAAAPLSQDEMLLQLLDAVQADQTGIMFAETARSLRCDLRCIQNSLQQQLRCWLLSC